MKTKSFEIEVVTTKTVRVVIPESYNTEEMIRDWKEGLWYIDGVSDIAEYAADMSANYPGHNHDGVGVMIENSYTEPDYKYNPYQVVAYVEREDFETEIISEGEWNGG